MPMTSAQFCTTIHILYRRITTHPQCAHATACAAAQTHVVASSHTPQCSAHHTQPNRMPSQVSAAQLNVQHDIATCTFCNCCQGSKGQSRYRYPSSLALQKGHVDAVPLSSHTFL